MSGSRPTPESAEVERIELARSWSLLWDSKWLIVSVATVFAFSSVIFSLMQQEIYRSEALLAPVVSEGRSPLNGQLGGLAALAGISIESESTTEAIAVLRSRDFAREFIEANSLMVSLFPDRWDEAQETWVADAEGDEPDIRDAVKLFREGILRVDESGSDELITVAIEWTDSALAAQWAAMVVERINDRLRQRALQEAEANVAYLQRQLAQTDLVTLQQSIGRLLEAELQKLMLARGSEEFAFRVIDTPQIPKERVRPRRAFIVILGTLIGGMLAVLLVFSLHAIRRN